MLPVHITCSPEQSMLKPEVIFTVLSKIRRTGFKPPVNAGSCRGALAGAAVLLNSPCKPWIPACSAPCNSRHSPAVPGSFTGLATIFRVERKKKKANLKQDYFKTAFFCYAGQDESGIIRSVPSWGCIAKNVRQPLAKIKQHKDQSQPGDSTRTYRNISFSREVWSPSIPQPPPPLWLLSRARLGLGLGLGWEMVYVLIFLSLPEPSFLQEKMLDEGFKLILFCFARYIHTGRQCTVTCNNRKKQQQQHARSVHKGKKKCGNTHAAEAFLKGIKVQVES